MEIQCKTCDLEEGLFLTVFATWSRTSSFQNYKKHISVVYKPCGFWYFSYSSMNGIRQEMMLHTRMKMVSVKNKKPEIKLVIYIKGKLKIRKAHYFIRNFFIATVSKIISMPHKRTRNKQCGNIKRLSGQFELLLWRDQCCFTDPKKFLYGHRLDLQ